MLAVAAVGQNTTYVDRAMNATPSGRIVVMQPLQYGFVRVCNLPLTQQQPCLPLATVFDAVTGAPLSNAIAGGMGQVKTDGTGLFVFGCVPQLYWVQVFMQGNNNPELNYPATCPAISPFAVNTPRFDNIRFADQFTSIQAACNDAPGGDVYIGAGTYQPTSSINCTAPTKFIGAGINVTIIKPTNALAGGLFTMTGDNCCASTALSEGWALSNMTIDMTNVGANDAIVLSGLHNVFLDHVRIVYPSNGSGKAVNIFNTGGLWMSEWDIVQPGYCVYDVMWDGASNAPAEHTFTNGNCAGPGQFGMYFEKPINLDAGSIYAHDVRVVQAPTFVRNPSGGWRFKADGSHFPLVTYLDQVFGDGSDGLPDLQLDNVNEIHITHSWFRSIDTGGSACGVKVTGVTGLYMHDTNLAIGVPGSPGLAEVCFYGDAITIMLSHNQFLPPAFTNPDLFLDNTGTKVNWQFDTNLWGNYATAGNKISNNDAAISAATWLDSTPGAPTHPNGIRVWVNNADQFDTFMSICDKAVEQPASPTPCKYIGVNNQGWLTFLGNANQTIGILTDTGILGLLSNSFQMALGSPNVVNLNYPQPGIGGVGATSLNAAGTGYAVNDTGTLAGSSVQAFYTVDAIGGGGAVTQYHISNSGAGYVTANAVSTTAVTGTGTGLKLNILGVNINLNFPATSDTIVGRATVDSLSNKTLIAPIIGAGTAIGRYARFSATLSPAIVNANTCAAQSFTVTGITNGATGNTANVQSVARNNNVGTITLTAALPASFVVGAQVTLVNTVYGVGAGGFLVSMDGTYSILSTASPAFTISNTGGNLLTTNVPVALDPNQNPATATVGNTTGDILIAVSKPTEQAGLMLTPGHVTGANTATINFCNVTGAGITPTASESYQFVVVQ